MPGARPEPGPLTKENDLSKTAETRQTIERMIDALNDYVLDGIEEFFHEDFRWIGNAGCGTKNGLEEFKRNWMLPFRTAFTDKVCTDEARIVQGEWMAGFGTQVATHSRNFMGIAPTGKRVKIRYTDFRKVTNGKIFDNWVTVEFPHVLHQLGVDPFNGEGREAFDQDVNCPHTRSRTIDGIGLYQRSPSSICAPQDICSIRGIIRPHAAAPANVTAEASPNARS